MSRLLALFAPLLLAACNVGVIPRDLPPPAPEATPEPAPEPTEPTSASTPTTGPASGPTEYRLEGHRLELPGPIVFQTGSDILDPASDPALEHVRGYLVAKSAVSTLRIEGHADDQALSERRALAVGRWLVAHGSECTRLLPVGFGPNKPIADASSPEGRAQNTRIELHNAALLGRPIGGMPLDGGGLVAGDLCQ
ncbi:OmpA family protein [Nannocystis sp.]|uniref:OmpA family protein n=1 Tax=Nannocystis sp. TaxID=1962667 RepID=UPI0025FCD68E|nr:OmpA family protein [Nannocystis sp.]MBK7824473.1 OmpA family protein [Nannocystis sp.]